ncbi:MAG: hypothetical protein Kow0081_4050 [Candidatus Dojkabacteria bacterium]
MADFWTMRRMFKEKDIKLLSVSENFDDSTPSSEFLMGIMSAQAQFYSANLGHEVKKGIMQKVKNGWWPNNAPLGYENYGAKHDRKIRPREDARKHIIRAFKLFSTGEYSISSLSDELRDSGFKSNNGQLVSRSKIGKMLKNPIYYGEFLWKGELYKGKHEPLISKELFDSIQKILKNRRTKGTRDRKHNFMLRGYVFCTCGSMLTGELKKKKFKNGKQQTYFFFGCKNTKKKKACSRVYIRMEELETMVTDIFKEVEFEDIFKDEIMKEAKNIIQEVRETETEEETNIKQNVAKIKTRMANAEDDRLDRVINREEFSRIYERLKVDLEKEQVKLAQLQSGHDKLVNILNELLGLTENIYETYTSAPDEIKRQYLNLFIDRVEEDNKKIVSVRFTPIVEQLVEINRVRISDNWRRRQDSNLRSLSGYSFSRRALSTTQALLPLVPFSPILWI